MSIVPRSESPAFRILVVLILLIGLSSTGVVHAKCPAEGDKQDPPIDLVVSETCSVGPGKYYYHNVNIVSGGTLDFSDSVIDFYAASIVIENQGSLIAGTDDHPIGGNLTIHLYGKNTDAGVSCKSDEHCGVPGPIWTSNTATTLNPASCTSVENIVVDGEKPYKSLPGNVLDCFYQYGNLPDTSSFFGHKVLAVSYGGTLKLFGKTGALYPKDNRETADERKEDLQCEQQARCSGRSWVRLEGSLKPGDSSLTVDGKVDWQDGNHIVVTTTDYLPGHSEELIIDGTPVPVVVEGNNQTRIKFKPARPVEGQIGVRWPHNGMTYPIPQQAVEKTKLGFDAAETRAAVALLSRSIQIVSDGASAGEKFEEKPGNYFGGHLIARQGFEAFHVKGVEFKQMGQGGDLGRYAVHFHLARKTPKGTYVKDSSVNESMTRWFTIHGTHDVTLERNVGYLSIGHGYYLEDATEIDNRLHANLGIFARAAIDNDQNPRKVPGILASRSTGGVKVDEFGYQSDYQNPSVFWIMNGWNDFKYNMAAGAGTCGACYWVVPGANSGPSTKMKWDGYAAEQQFRPGFAMQSPPRAGMTPLKDFVGNFCTSAMHSFQVTGRVGACQGLGDNSLPVVPNLKAPNSPSDLSQTANTPDPYYPVMAQTGTRFATRCPKDEDCGSDKVPRCGDGSGPNPNDKLLQKNCDVTVLDRYTTSFNWARPDSSAVWLRNQWALFSNSVITDVQGSGLTMVTGGGYSKSDVITGYWGLAWKSAFIGDTQFSQTDNPLKGNPYASNAGPFNPLKADFGTGKDIFGLKCSNGANQALHCSSTDEGVAFQLLNFLGFQRLFNVYDGPSYQDSNVYLSIHPTILTGCKFGEGSNPTRPCLNTGWAQAEQVLGPRRSLTLVPPEEICYLPNAGIGWKQPNGFYYPPAFHSKNLYFGDDTNESVDKQKQYEVAIRHYVIEPLFIPGKLVDNIFQVSAQYCNWNPGDGENPSLTFSPSFSAIDRMTVLNDDDGSLTGLRADAANIEKIKPTLSINTDPFFEAPTATPECASDRPLGGDTQNARALPATAYTSPYQYVSTVLYPLCAANDSGQCPSDKNWDRDCTDPRCYGVPLYRQLLNAGEPSDETQQIRMMGQIKSQRGSLTVNHGVYYIDTTKGEDVQNTPLRNVFQANDIYYVFFLYAKHATKQTYQIYVGKDDAYKVKDNVKGIRVNIPGKYTFAALDPIWPKKWERVYHPDSGMLEVTVDMSSPKLADEFNKKTSGLSKELCQPASMCSWKENTQECTFNPAAEKDPRFNGKDWSQQDKDAVCRWSVRDFDCPSKGCIGFEFKMSSQFVADNADHRTWSYVDNKEKTQAYPRLFSEADDSESWKKDNFCRPEKGESDKGQCFYPNAPVCPKYPK